MKILVTGGLGAVGAPLVQQLRQRGNDVHIMDLPHHHDPKYHRGDVGKFPQVMRVVENVKPDLVYHLGAEFGRMNGEDFYETMWTANAIGTKNVLRLQEEHGFRMVFASSSEVYGDHGGVMDEDVPETVAIRQLNDYAISKWVNEMQILNSADRFGTETVRVRLFNTYGPGEPYSDYRSVVCLFVNRALRGQPFTVFTEHTRTLTYIDDCVDALANISESFHPGEVYNIAGDDNVTMKELADLIIEKTGADPQLAEHVPVEAHNTLHKKSTNAKSKHVLGMKTRVPLSEGIERTVQWHRAEYGL